VQLLADLLEVDAYLQAVCVFIGVDEVRVFQHLLAPESPSFVERVGDLYDLAFYRVECLHYVFLHIVSLFEGRRSAPVVIRPYDLVVIEIVCDS